MYREQFVSKIDWLPGFLSESNFGELAVEALVNDILYVALDLRLCPRGKWFEDTLKKWISKEVFFQYPSCSRLLSKGSCCSWVENILHVTNKRYLFLFIDENEALKEEKLHSFADLGEIDEFTGRSNPFVLFLGVAIILSVSVFHMPHCRNLNCIFEADECYALSPLSIDFIDLDPFSKNDIESFVRGTTFGDDSILRLLFRSSLQGCT